MQNRQSGKKMSEDNLKNLSIRNIKWEDRRLLFEWVNDPLCRRYSFDSNPIQWVVHIAWLHRKLNDPGSFLYLVSDSKSDPVAHVRFDRIENEEFQVGINVHPDMRNSGYGTAALKMACNTFFGQLDFDRIIAQIKRENKASVTAFTRAGFTNTGVALINETEAVVMVLSKNQFESD